MFVFNFEFESSFIITEIKVLHLVVPSVLVLLVDGLLGIDEGLNILLPLLSLLFGVVGKIDDVMADGLAELGFLIKHVSSLLLHDFSGGHKTLWLWFSNEI